MAGWNKLLFETDATASATLATLSATQIATTSAVITSLAVTSATISGMALTSLTVQQLSVISTVSFNSCQLQNAVIETVATVSDLNDITPVAARFMAVTSTSHLYIYF